jgi:hypothetical protein
MNTNKNNLGLAGKRDCFLGNYWTEMDWAGLDWPHASLLSSSYTTGRVLSTLSTVKRWDCKYGRPLIPLMQLGHSARPPFGLEQFLCLDAVSRPRDKYGRHTRFFPAHSHTALPESSNISPPGSISVLFLPLFSPHLVWLLAVFGETEMFKCH